MTVPTPTSDDRNAARTGSTPESISSGTKWGTIVSSAQPSRKKTTHRLQNARLRRAVATVSPGSVERSTAATAAGALRRAKNTRTNGSAPSSAIVR